MQCPQCQEPAKVLEVRPGKDGRTRRYSRCPRCRQRFTTIESLDVTGMVVTKRDGSKQPFSRKKVLDGIKKAVISEIPTAELNELADKIAQELLFTVFDAFESVDVQAVAADTDGPAGAQMQMPALTSRMIGNAILKVLGEDRRWQAVRVRYALLFEPDQEGRFHDAQTLAAVLVSSGLVSASRATAPARQPQRVIKRSGPPEQFSHHKLVESIKKTVKKRPPAEGESSNDSLGELLANLVVDQVAYQVTVTSGQLASEIMNLFRWPHPQVDSMLGTSGRELAYLRAASTSKQFSTANDFAMEAAGVIERRRLGSSAHELPRTSTQF